MGAAVPMFPIWLLILAAVGGLGLVALLVVGIVLFGQSRSRREDPPRGD